MHHRDKLKVAILDMYKEEPNLGMACIREILENYSDDIDVDEFEVRSKLQLPNTNYDIYISTGGPGSPLPGDGDWEDPYYNLLDKLWTSNHSNRRGKKYCLFICHSFQLVAQHFEVGEIRPRKSTCFGIHSINKTSEGHTDPILSLLPDPFYGVEKRDWQLVNPRQGILKALGASVIAIEKDRPHVDLERAVMAIRFSKEFVGFQFHPEAEPVQLHNHFQKEKTKRNTIRDFGERRYNNLINHSLESDKIPLTYQTVIPTFLENAINTLTPKRSVA